MALNWPPPTAPVWPPAGYSGLQFGSLEAAQAFAEAAEWTYRSPTNTENRTYFRDARCNEDHTLTGLMLVVDDIAYPFARCNGPAGERTFMVLWGPDYVAGAT